MKTVRKTTRLLLITLAILLVINVLAQPVLAFNLEKLKDKKNITVDVDEENNVINVYINDVGGEWKLVATFEVDGWTVYIWVDPPGGTNGPLE